MPTTRNLEGDAGLPAKVVSVSIQSPWITPPTKDFFGSGFFPRRPVPEVDWIIQFKEDEIRKRLVDRLSTGLSDGDKLLLARKFTDLPGTFATVSFTNMIYNVDTQTDDLIPPRLGNEFCINVYTLAQHYIVSTMLDMFMQEIPPQGLDVELNRRYTRLKQVKDHIDYCGYQLMLANPTLIRPYQVIVSAKEVSKDAPEGERPIIYVDKEYLDIYLANGGTLRQLCDNWLANQTQPPLPPKK